MRLRTLIFVVAFLLAVAAGYLVARSAAPRKQEPPVAAGKRTQVRQPHEVLEPDPQFRKNDRPKGFRPDQEALEAGALVGQRSLVFKDRAAMEAFLARAGNRVRVMGRIDVLSALRIGFLSYDDLAELLDGSEEIGMIFPAVFPENEASVTAQPGAMPMGNSLLEWLGITGDHSAWGSGIKIAVLDTGVSPHPAFGGHLVALGAAGDVNGHGTAVASMILGNTSLLPGVAPGATVISIQVADQSGYSDSFKIAQGILAAVEAGAKVINISLGSTGDSAILRNAVNFALDAGVLIVAPTGNAGGDQILRPAGYEGVIAVGAVDKAGEVMSFSNKGAGIDLVAPGYGLNAAYTEEGAVSVSGTSFSGPIVAGLIAGVMDQLKVTNRQAWELIQANINETGAPGYDTSYGYGTPDMGRILASSTKGIHDAAVASYWVDPDAPGMMQVTVQNRGTEPLINTGVTVNGPAGTSYFNATTLNVGGIQTFSVPIGWNSTSALRFDTSVAISGGQGDARPANNRRVENYTRPQSK